jgi:Ca2+-binding EF-hand superfamily protein
MFNNEVKEHFKDIWSHYDMDATGKIHKDDLIDFLFEVGDPLGWDKQKMEKDG